MYERWGKRACDILVASLLLLALAPLLALLAIVVRLRLGPPVLFVQARAGRGGCPFRLPKFRSMREGVDDDADRLDHFGRALRASALDELPQLVCVLRGEMSLVGPRPLPMAYLAHYTPRQALRCNVRPGLAGPGVAAGRNAIGWPERLERDAAYAAAPLRLWRDLGLLCATLGVWLAGRGAHAPGHATMPPFDMASQPPDRK
jgi:lipopolysaccharide/colanic/teichoic acid biosynthesis glycosyltransferase